MKTPQAFRGSDRRHRASAILAIACVALVSACQTPTPKAEVEKSDTDEYFAESEYGVKASPRVADAGKTSRRSAGRYKVGKPYKVKGKWYHPKEDPDYVRVGAASWYGSAFHGRLTANGEVYDMNRLTAAHPTMPLPSYARVTNMDNGSSVLVRVNDRGPFAHNRVIDLSKRAAALLDYTGSGVAEVKVEYAGRAPLERRDDRYLMASYRPGDAESDPADGVPGGVMVAMNGASSSADLPGVKAVNAVAGADRQPAERSAGGAASIALPASGPLVPDRPGADGTPTEVALLSYADRRVHRAARAFDTVLETPMNADGIRRWWRGRASSQKTAPDTAATPGEGYLVIGSWSSMQDAREKARRLQRFGRPVMEVDTDPAGRRRVVVTLEPNGRMALDGMLRAAWRAGAEGAFAVRR